MYTFSLACNNYLDLLQLEELKQNTWYIHFSYTCFQDMRINSLKKSDYWGNKTSLAVYINSGNCFGTLVRNYISTSINN